MNSKSIINRKVKNLTATALGALVMSGGIACAADKPADAHNFYKSGKVASQKVEFNNQYKMKMAGNLFLPGDMDKDAKYPAIVVGHPMGAVKEQSANLYAVKMAPDTLRRSATSLAPIETRGLSSSTSSKSPMASYLMSMASITLLVNLKGLAVEAITVVL